MPTRSRIGSQHARPMPCPHEAVYMIPVLGSPTPPPWYPPPPTLPKPNLCDCAHVFHIRAPKATTVTRIAPQDARSV